MPNDAKLGLVLGIGLVVIIGLVFFRADPAVESANPQPARVSASQETAP